MGPIAVGLIRVQLPPVVLQFGAGRPDLMTQIGLRKHCTNLWAPMSSPADKMLINCIPSFCYEFVWGIAFSDQLFLRQAIITL